MTVVPHAEKARSTAAAVVRVAKEGQLDRAVAVIHIAERLAEVKRDGRSRHFDFADLRLRAADVFRGEGQGKIFAVKTAKCHAIDSPRPLQVLISPSC